MATRTIPGPVIDEANIVLENVLLFSMDARALSTSAYHKVEVGLAAGEDTTWIGTWDQSSQKIDAGESLRILDDGRVGMRLPEDKALVVRVTSSGSPSTIETAKVDFVLSRVGGRAGARKPLLADVEAAIRSVTRQLASWTYPVYLRDPEDTTYFSPYILDASNATVTVASSTTETTLYSTTIPAGLLSGHRTVRVSMHGSFVNNTGADRTFTLKITYDNTVVYEDATGAIPSSASTRPWRVVFEFSPTNQATSAQVMGGELAVGQAGGATSGYGSLDFSNVLPIGGTSSEDATTALTLAVTTTLSFSSASLSMVKNSARAEVL